MEVRNHGSRLDAMKNRNIFLADGKSMIKMLRKNKAGTRRSCMNDDYHVIKRLLIETMHA